MLILLLSVFLATLASGIALISVAAVNHSTSKRLGFPRVNPLALVRLSERRDWWTPTGYRLHVAGLALVYIGLAANMTEVLLRWVF